MLGPLQMEKVLGAVRRDACWLPWFLTLTANIVGAAPPVDSARALQELLERGKVAEAEQRATRFLATARLENRADSIDFLVATRVLVAAELQQSRTDDPMLDSHVETLLRMSKSVLGPRSAFLADAHQYAGIVERYRNHVDSAIEHFEAALRIIESHNPPNHVERERAHHNLATTYFQSRRYAEAKHEFELDLEARKAIGVETAEVAVVIVNLNAAREASGDTLGIAADYDRARRIFERYDGPDSPRVADVLVRDGTWRSTCGNLAGAARMLDRAITILEKPGRRGIPLAEGIYERARVHLAAGESGSAVARAAEARDLFIESAGPSDPRVANCIMAIGDAQRSAFRNAEALSTFLEALRVHGSPARPDAAAQTNCLRRLASIALDLARYAEALGYARRALAASPGVWGARSSETAITRLGFAATLQGAQQSDSAKLQYERARDDLIANLGDANPLVAEPILRLATLARERGDLAQARAGAERAMEILESVDGDKDPRLCDAFHELGIVKRRLGDPGGARSDLEHALELVSKSGRESESQAAIVSSLGLLEWSLGNEEAAFNRLQEALAITGRVCGADHPRTAFIQRNLASLANARGRYPEARSLYEQALAILERSLGPDHPDVAATRLGLGNALKAMGDRAGARAQYEVAIDIHRNALGAEAPALALDYHNLATLSLEERNLPAAIEEAEEAERLGRQHFELIVCGVSEREALHFAADRIHGTDIVLTAAGRSEARGDWERAWDLVIRSRAAVLEEMAFRRRFTVTTHEPEVLALADRLAGASDHLAYLAVRGRSEGEPLPDFKRRLQAARLEKEAAERALAARSSEFNEATERARVGLSEVLKALPGRSVLIAWVQYNRLERTQSGGDHPEDGKPYYAAFVVNFRHARSSSGALGQCRRDRRARVEVAGPGGQEPGEWIPRDSGAGVRWGWTGLAPDRLGSRLSGVGCR